MADGGVLGIPAHSDREAYANFVEGLKVAESAAKQLAFYTERSQWILVEQALASIRNTAQLMAVGTFRGGIR